MADDDDAEFELFERQLQAAVAKVPRTTVPPAADAHKPDSPKPAPARPTPAQSTAPDKRPQVNKAQPTGRWKWDGTAWRWRSDLSAPPPSAQSQPSASSAPQPASQSPSTQPVAQAPKPAQHNASTIKRTAAGKVWHDPTLLQFPPNDHRLFVGDLAPDASEQHLDAVFSAYPSYNMSRVIRDKQSGACKGYAFLSFADGRDMLRALSEMNGKYVAGRPLKLKRGKWEKRALKGKWNQVKALRTITKR
ncbi:RNA-binding protein 42 [Gracilariopsis chorda]|uniref:RNA-binding protein 42 n=1 Tax=Gracilariopsis chorda TaxID=448386 RepID=A0A2V3IWZ6_9FLOR|nr:RNA-binding protein 42 [Gracilariopsis chorda]|eukprot:PXF46662.1 RNA-binding protein 42 [Gracilariopsis chorda]